MKHIRFDNRGFFALYLGLALTPFSFNGGPARQHSVYQGNGIKIGEVTPNSAIVWTRLTKIPVPLADGFRFRLPAEDKKDSKSKASKSKSKKKKKKGRTAKDTEPLYPDGLHADKMEGAMPGAQGQVRIGYYPNDKSSKPRYTKWLTVDPEKDFTQQVLIKNLLPGTSYSLTSQSRDGEMKVGATIKGSFRTAPDPKSRSDVKFAVITGQEYHRKDSVEGHKIYGPMKNLDPDFFIHTGDIIYYDKSGPRANSPDLARYKWNRMYAMPFQRSFHNHVASYFIKDDHDTLRNDCWPGQTYGSLTFDKGLSIFREQVPMGKSTYRRFRWGHHLEIWLVEGRDFRSPNTMEDSAEKTIWGKKQKKWFKDTVQKSDATFRLLISPTPLVGPDRKSKKDNHANPPFQTEGDELRKFISSQKNMAVICGDRHWQYHSVHPDTKVQEFSSGPTTDVHAGGSPGMDKNYHKYMAQIGGFLTVNLTSGMKYPRLVFKFHNVAGRVKYEYEMLAVK